MERIQADCCLSVDGRAFDFPQPRWFHAHIEGSMTSLQIATIVGAAAAIASTTSFLPQAIKIIRSRDTSCISTGMYAVTVAGFVLWTTYGILLGAWPLIVSNGISLVLSAFILMMKLLPRAEKIKVSEMMEPVVGSD